MRVREACGAYGGSSTFWVIFVVIMLSASGAVFGGDMNMKYFFLFFDDEVGDVCILVKECFSSLRGVKRNPHGFGGLRV